jgi:hypothetical protein
MEERIFLHEVVFPPPKHKRLRSPLNFLQVRTISCETYINSIIKVVTGQVRRQRRGHYPVRLNDANPWVKEDKFRIRRLRYKRLLQTLEQYYSKLPGLWIFNLAQSFTYLYRINPHIQSVTHQSWVSQKFKPCSQTFRIHSCSKCRLWIGTTLLPLWLISYPRWRYRFCSESVGALLSGGLYRYGELGVWKYAMGSMSRMKFLSSQPLYIYLTLINFKHLRSKMEANVRVWGVLSCKAS